MSFFNYAYPLIGDLHPCEKIAVADVKDLVAIKIIAIAQRGVKKDFIDLHAIMQAGWNFEAIFECVDLKYPHQKRNRLHLLKSLTYFKDAENDPMPKMFQATSWEAIKRDLTSRVEKFMLRA